MDRALSASRFTSCVISISHRDSLRPLLNRAYVMASLYLGLALPFLKAHDNNGVFTFKRNFASIQCRTRGRTRPPPNQSAFDAFVSIGSRAL